MSMNRKHKGGFVTAYGAKLVLGIDASATEESPGAIQSFKDECDINNIMLNVQRSGAAAWLAEKAGTFADVTGMDFQTSMDLIINAQEAFDALPSHVRDRFANDPSRFLDFVHDKGNQDELVRLGLADPPPVLVTETAPPKPA